MLGWIAMESGVQNLRKFETACRKAGLKVTHQRLEIYRELLQSRDHPTAEAIHRRLKIKLPTISLDTVYRTLATLAEQGLISRVETIESLARFEVMVVPHHHLICRRCGHIADFCWTSIDTAPLPDSVGDWGRVEHKNVVVYGTCKDCLLAEVEP